MSISKYAKKVIETIVLDPVVGELYYGKVVRIIPIGAFVEIAPGKDGMVHISKLENRRVEKVEDVVKEGDRLLVKVMEIDKKTGKYKLSHKVYTEAGAESIEKAYEIDPQADAELMRTRYCIRYELGMCPVHHRVKDSGPLFLLNNGRRLALHFDCRNCEMTVTLP